MFKLVFKQSQEEQTNKKQAFHLVSLLSSSISSKTTKLPQLTAGMESYRCRGWRACWSDDDSCVPHAPGAFFHAAPRFVSAPSLAALQTLPVLTWYKKGLQMITECIFYLSTLCFIEREICFSTHLCEIFQDVFLLTSSFNLYGSRIFQRHVLDQTGWVW